VLLTKGRQTPEISLLWLTALLLAIGVMVYAVDRGGAVYFLPAWFAHEAGASIFGSLGNHLPTFVHPFAFILITATVFWPWPRLLPAICATWFAIEVAFEMGQLDPIGQRIAATLPAWFDGVPLLEAAPAYFALGTYDPFDVLSIGLGAVSAFLIVRYIQRGGMK